MPATHQLPAPTAMPTTTAKITYAVSCVSRTTVRNRTIDSAPTSANARAALPPTTCVTIAMSTAEQHQRRRKTLGDFVSARLPVDQRHQRAERQRDREPDQHLDRMRRRVAHERRAAENRASYLQIRGQSYARSGPHGTGHRFFTGLPSVCHRRTYPKASPRSTRSHEGWISYRLSILCGESPCPRCPIRCPLPRRMPVRSSSKTSRTFANWSRSTSASKDCR